MRQDKILEEIFAAKKARRRELAKLPIEEKLEILIELQKICKLIC